MTLLTAFSLQVIAVVGLFAAVWLLSLEDQ